MNNLYVTVNYFSNNDVYNYLESLKNILDANDKVIIVNNCCLENRFTCEDENILILNSENNLGYFGGIKFALNSIDINFYNSIIVSNPDLIFDKDFNNKLKEIDYSWDVIAPKIISSNGKNQNPHRLRKPGYFISFYLYLSFKSYLIYKILRFLINRLRKNKKTINLSRTRIFSPHGAIIIFNENYFLKGGKIEDHFFLYGEEDSVAGQSEKLGLEIIYEPNIEVLHIENSTTSSLSSKSKFNFQQLAYKKNKKKYKTNLFKL